MKKLLISLALFLPLAPSAQAAITNFDLIGTAGSGLLPGNEPGSILGGTGGEIGAGIFFDNATNFLTINVGWGSSQGFTDLSSLANNSHIHGPTTSANGAGFTETAGVLLSLTRSSNLVTGGFFTSAPLSLTATQATQLIDGKFYINLHTVNNGGGEMRGFLVAAPIPEPAEYAMLLAGLALVGTIARRRKQMA